VRWMLEIGIMTDVSQLPVITRVSG
jgi:hypothetical protein